MSIYEVYYRKNETYQVDQHLKGSDIRLQKTHSLVAIKEGDKDTVFRAMQGEFMIAPTKSILTALIKSGATHHTSMSVGDVLLDCKTGAIYQCDTVGWVKVK